MKGAIREMGLKLMKLILFLAVVVIIVGLVYFYVLKKDHVKNEEIVFSINLGDYYLNEIDYEKDGSYFESCGISLRDDNEFYINVGEGFGYHGKYKIENNIIICNANTYSGEYIEDEATDIVFRFKSISDNTLELISIDINDENKSKAMFDSNFEIGMTYSIK